MANGAGGRREGAGRSPGKRRTGSIQAWRGRVCVGRDWKHWLAARGCVHGCCRQGNGIADVPFRTTGRHRWLRTFITKEPKSRGLRGKATISIRSRYEHSCSN